MNRDEEKAALHLKLGTAHLQSGDYPQALVELSKAEELDPDNPSVQNNLGLAYFVREKYDKAEEHLRNALELKEDFTEARNNLARTLIEKGEFAEAIKEATIVLKDLTYPTPVKAQVNLGLGYFYLRNWPQAKENFNKAVSSQPDYCLAQNFLGRTMYEMKTFEAAAESLDRASAVCKREQFDEPTYFAGLAYLELKNINFARARWDELIKLYPNGKYVERSKLALKSLAVKN